MKASIFHVFAAFMALQIAVCLAQTPATPDTIFTPEYIKNNVDYGLVEPTHCDKDYPDSMIVPSYADAAIPTDPSQPPKSTVELTNSINYTQILNRVKGFVFEDLPSDISPWTGNGGTVYKAPVFYTKCWNRTAGAFPANCTGTCISNYANFNSTWQSFGALACNGFYPKSTPKNSSMVFPPAGSVSIILTNQCTQYLYRPPAGTNQTWIATIYDEFGDEWALQTALNSPLTTDQQWFDALKGLILPDKWTMSIRNITEATAEKHYSYNMGADCWVPVLKDNQGWSWHAYKYQSGKVYTGVLSKISCPPYVPTTTPSPSLSPSPSPSPSQKCAYSGDYNIMPQLINCGGQYAAWASPSNCNQTSVGVKTENQLGGKPTRAVWTINGEASKNLNIVAAKDCVNNNLDISLRGIVLTRVEFPWQIQPVDSADCNTVNIVAPSRNGAKYLGIGASNMPGSCSKSFTFTSTAGAQNVFKLVKA